LAYIIKNKQYYRTLLDYILLKITVNVTRKIVKTKHRNTVALATEQF